MTSEIFNFMGIGNLDPAIFIFILLGLVIIAFILIIIQYVKLSNMKKTYQKFMKGKNVKSMESEIISLFEDINFLKIASSKNAESIKNIENNLLFAYQKVGIVRYDAFREMGGKLSFSIALLNDKNNGFILNSVHSTEGCYTYTKEIVGGESYITLGEEEKEALEKAMKSNKDLNSDTNTAKSSKKGKLNKEDKSISNLDDIDNSTEDSFDQEEKIEIKNYKNNKSNEISDLGLEEI